MRSTYRLFLATILLTAVAGFALAQEPSEPPPPPPPAPEVVQPVTELPPIPVAEPIATVVEPAVTAEPIAPAVEPPVAVAPLEPPAAEKQVVTTTKRVTKKTVKKPVEQPAIRVSESARPAAAAASAAAVDTNGSAPPPNAAANTAPPVSIAPPPPAAKSVTVETRSEEVVPQKPLGIGSWILFGLGVLGLAGIATKLLRRQLRSPTSIVDFTSIHPEVKPALVTRP